MNIRHVLVRHISDVFVRNKYYMDLTLHGLFDIVDTGLSPEITHFKMGKHPGKHWWLKTVIPKNDTDRITTIWMHLCRMHPSLIYFTPYAYDWYGVLLEDFQSVWIKEQVDVVLTVKKRVFDYDIISFPESFNVSGKNLQKLIKLEQQNNPDTFTQDEWNEIINVTEFMKSWTTDKQAKNNRKQLRKI